MYRTNHEYRQDIVHVIQQQQFDIKTIDGTYLKRVEHFKYLGACLDSSEKDIKLEKCKVV